MRTYLERIDPAAGMARFYVVSVRPMLFGEWAVIREWGRIGRGGTVRERTHSNADEATASAAATVDTKRRRGYRERSAGKPLL